MLCQNCKATLPETAKFCNKCGTKTQASRLCPNGHVLEPDEAICRYCPPVAGLNNNRMSVSTTIDKPFYPAAVSSSMKPTTVESEVYCDDRATVNFGATRIIQAQEEEPVGVLGWLVIFEGADRWRDFKVSKRKVVVGRSSECDIVLNSSQVSTKHASLRLMDDGLYLTDLDSSNGTYVNDQMVEKQKLSDNDLVRIGDITMKFKAF